MDTYKYQDFNKLINLKSIGTMNFFYQTLPEKEKISIFGNHNLAYEN